jgi:hypothetical protein
MEKQILEKKIEDKKAQIEKLKGLKAKYEQKAAYAKDHPNPDDWQSKYAYSDACDLVKATEERIGEATVQLEKLGNLLKAESAKDDVPEIRELREFIDAWGVTATGWIRGMLPLYAGKYDAFRSLDSELCDLHNGATPEQRKDPAWIETYRRKEAEREDLRKQVNSYPDYFMNILVTNWDDTGEKDRYGYPVRRRRFSLDEAGLAKFIEREKRNRYFNLVMQVTPITGEITGTERLSMGDKGDINGFVHGKKGTAHVQTFGAGGENVGVIVNVKCGPIYHYRTRVDAVK